MFSYYSGQVFFGLDVLVTIIEDVTVGNVYDLFKILHNLTFIGLHNEVYRPARKDALDMIESKVITTERQTGTFQIIVFEKMGTNLMSCLLSSRPGYEEDKKALARNRRARVLATIDVTLFTPMRTADGQFVCYKSCTSKPFKVLMF